MLLITIDRCVPEMVTAAAILHPRGAGMPLVQAGVKLTEALIQRMRDLKVAQVWVQHPRLADLEPVILSRIPERRRVIYDTIRTSFDELQNRVITTDDYERYCSVITELIYELIGGGGRAGDLAERLFTDDDELAGHCSSVAYLSVTIGLRLQDYIFAERRDAAFGGNLRDLTSLGVGAMLHDLGKLDGPESIRRQHELTPRRHKDYPSHNVRGFRMLRHRINPLATTVALHHHQRWDGSGWPAMDDLTHGRYRGGLRGRRTHIFARIVAAANLFDNLTSGLDGKGRRPAIFALNALQDARLAGYLDPVILDALLRCLPPFPTGMEVILSDGRRAAVTEINADDPCRPRVRLLEEPWGDDDIDLRTRTDLAIRRAGDRDVTAWLYGPPRRLLETRRHLSEAIV